MTCRGPPRRHRKPLEGRRASSLRSTLSLLRPSGMTNRVFSVLHASLDAMRSTGPEDHDLQIRPVKVSYGAVRTRTNLTTVDDNTSVVTWFEVFSWTSLVLAATTPARQFFAPLAKPVFPTKVCVWERGSGHGCQRSKRRGGCAPQQRDLV